MALGSVHCARLCGETWCSGDCTSTPLLPRELLCQSPLARARSLPWNPSDRLLATCPSCPDTTPCPALPPCSFFVQLALLDLECAGHAPSLLAAAALSVSLEAFGKPAWPVSLQQFGSYLPAELEPVKRRLVDLQGSQVGRGASLLLAGGWWPVAQGGCA